MFVPEIIALYCVGSAKKDFYSGMKSKQKMSGHERLFLYCFKSVATHEHKKLDPLTESNL